MSFTNNFGRVQMQTQCGSLIVSSQSWKQDHKDTEDYLLTFNEGLHSFETGQFLFGFNKDDLEARNALVTTIQTSNGEPLGGVHWHLNDAGEMWLRGAIVRPKHRGNQLGAAMVATSLIHAHMIGTPLPTPVCVIRIFGDNTENVASRKTFERVGFLCDADVMSTYINFDWKDQHLGYSAEVDQNGRHYFRSRKMFGTASVFDTARTFLGNWSQRAAA
ncbi:MAG: hypothetical protein OIF58_05110 [Cohaesibacter sp.]|nr:hypothetical protein [Cohaesibacter sp.]